MCISDYNAIAKKEKDRDDMANESDEIIEGQSHEMEYSGYGDCPACGDDCAEFWVDKETGIKYVRCPFIGCDNWGKMVKVHE